MTVRILIEAVLLLGLLWIWSFYYERSFDRQQFGARAVGFEIDPKLVYQSRQRIEKRKLTALASIEQQDLMAADFSKPDLITVYLLPSSNDKIQPLLEDQVKSGARVVSHDFTFRGWEIGKEIVVEDPTDEEIPTHKLFLYRR